MQQQIRVFQLFQRRLKRLHQLMGQFADKSNGIADRHGQRITDDQAAGRGVQRIKEAVVRGNARAGQTVQKRGLARVRIAHNGHNRNFPLLPPVPLGTPHPAHVLQIRFQLVDFPADMAAVRLQLRFAGAFGTDRAAPG